ncbi:hypothetical protein DPMN_126168 [Dreissena polymorpha]|uniref:Uncharacterized protein n=1 Tax=Dreissena polymorpha TaxID=45954 RepID=A0A9D4GWK9_DREPO|nr:hypothetical protein DPMN_126168 [Dreissena polymorpha]
MSTEDKKRKKEINSTGSISEIELSESPESQNHGFYVTQCSWKVVFSANQVYLLEKTSRLSIMRSS